MIWLRNLSLLLVVCCLPGVAQAADLDEAEGYVDFIREADLPQVSTDTAKEDPSGQPVTDYKPSGPSPTSEEPPSPVDRNNPTGDPDVQRGYDEQQEWYYGKEE